jgi:hypothetical protein
MTILREEVPQVVINALIFGCRLSLGDVLLSNKKNSADQMPKASKYQRKEKGPMILRV